VCRSSLRCTFQSMIFLVLEGGKAETCSNYRIKRTQLICKDIGNLLQALRQAANELCKLIHQAKGRLVSSAGHLLRILTFLILI
jgi:hypothetical protein